MHAKLYTAALVGLDCTIVEVEVDNRKATTYISIVGLADKSVQEARDRIPSAIRNSGGEFVPLRIIINLAPAELRKSGPQYDLPIAIGYLLASNQLHFQTKGKIFIGELSLDGQIRPVTGILPIADSVKKMGFEELYVPIDNAPEAGLIEGISIYAVSTLRQLMDHLNEIVEMSPYERKELPFEQESESQFDMKLVKGQAQAKRAMEIAAAGGHNVLLSGVPGSGKTLLSRTFATILPSMTTPEKLEVTRLYSVAGKTSKEVPLIMKRPFRSPHHTSSQVALVGGGGQIKPGEISLAHRGVLFLDEFPEFTPQALEALRQPLEDKIVTISRASGSLTFPANFTLVAAMNPCKCGYKGDPDKECSCTSIESSRYLRRISGPILDRIDLLINVRKVKHESLLQESEEESSETVRKRVQGARDIQFERYKKTDAICNGDLSQKQIKDFIKANEESRKLLSLAMERVNMSARAYFRLLKVSRTIADLEGAYEIEEKHVAEALSYRVDIGG